MALRTRLASFCIIAWALTGTTISRAQVPEDAAPAPDFASVVSADPGVGTPEPEYYAGRGYAPEAPRIRMSLFDAAYESLFGDAYAPGSWHELPLRTFFSEGWDEAWAGGPAGREGTTPRHGWLGAFDGVFYRLWFANFSYSRDIRTSFGGERYQGDYVIFLPFNRRFEVMIDVPFVISNGTADRARGYSSTAGDMVVAPRFLLSETEATTQTLAMWIRTPTGSIDTGGGITSLSPRYEFWTNPGGSWVLRGGAGPVIPLDSRDNTSLPTSFTGDIALGRYLRPHDVPFGDLVIYAACNFLVPLQGSASKSYAGVGPGTRFHLGRDYFFLHFWEFPVTGERPNDFNMQTALLKVF